MPKPMNEPKIKNVIGNQIGPRTQDLRGINDPNRPKICCKNKREEGVWTSTSCIFIGIPNSKHIYARIKHNPLIIYLLNCFVYFSVKAVDNYCIQICLNIDNEL